MRYNTKSPAWMPFIILLAAATCYAHDVHTSDGGAGRRLIQATTAADADNEHPSSSSPIDSKTLSDDPPSVPSIIISKDINQQQLQQHQQLGTILNDDSGRNLHYIRYNQYNLNTYPNPYHDMYYTTAAAAAASPTCRIPHNTPHAVAFCDPDHVLSSSDIPPIVQTISTFPQKHTIPCPYNNNHNSQGALTTTTITGVQIGIALMSTMNVAAINTSAAGNKYGYNNNNNNNDASTNQHYNPYHYTNNYDQQVQDAGERFAKYLHHTWSIGDGACPCPAAALIRGGGININNNNNNNNAGILIFMSVNDHEIYIATGNLVKKYLPDWKVKNIIEQVKPLLRMQLFDEATRLILKESGSYLDHGSSGSHQSASSSSLDYYDANASTISTIFGYIILFACCGLCCSTCSGRKCGSSEYHSQWNNAWERQGVDGTSTCGHNNGYYGSAGWGGGVGSGPGGWFGGDNNSYSYQNANNQSLYNNEHPPPAFNPNLGGSGGAGGTWGGVNDINMPSAPPAGGDGGAGGTW